MPKFSRGFDRRISVRKCHKISSTHAPRGHFRRKAEEYPNTYGLSSVQELGLQIPEKKIRHLVTKSTSTVRRWINI